MWIDVKERLPHNMSEVLGAFWNGHVYDVYPTQYDSNRGRGAIWTTADGIGGCEPTTCELHPTYWMEYPDPPTKEPVNG